MTITNPDAAERSAMARAYHNKRTHCGRPGCQMPSDSLTPTQKRDLNGPEITYSLDKPVSKPDFKKWPADVQKMYLQKLVDRFGCNQVEIGRMMGYAHSGVHNLFSRLGVTAPDKAFEREAFRAWCEGGIPSTAPAEAPDPIPEQEPVCQETFSVDPIDLSGVCRERTLTNQIQQLQLINDELSHDLEIANAQLEMVRMIFGGGKHDRKD